MGSVPTGNFYAVGMKHARVYELNANGVPNASGTAPYTGYQITGAKAYELSIPDARRIAHVGDDRVLVQDVLPRTEVSSGTLRFASDNHTVYAALTGTNAVTVGESSMIGYGTDKQGTEPTIALLCYQQVKSASKARAYRAYHVPNTQALVNPNTMDENAAEFSASLLPSASGHYIWGTAFTSGAEGYTEAEVVESITYDLPIVTAWKTDGTQTVFNFEAGLAPGGTTDIFKVTSTSSAGVVTDLTATATKGTVSITTAGTVATGAVISCWHQYPD